MGAKVNTNRQVPYADPPVKNENDRFKDNSINWEKYMKDNNMTNKKQKSH
ncbi:MAG: hypothetical protein J4F36_13205 [Nitrosopumilaceae archaeon]|nr:hypothetical protein [Nitrosopumilaceae archaeon]